MAIVQFDESMKGGSPSYLLFLRFNRAGGGQARKQFKSSTVCALCYRTLREGLVQEVHLGRIVCSKYLRAND